MRKLLALTATAATALALVLTACDPHPQGSAGTVVAKADRYSSATHSRHYFLTTRDAAGGRHEFEASIGDYRSCYRGSTYPACAKR